MLSLIKDALSIIYPNICQSCDEHLIGEEETICTTCLLELPFTNHNYSNNLLANKLMAISPIDGVYALTYFNTGNQVEKLIYQLKYRNNKNVGLRLGALLAEKTKQITQEFDIAIPVPLHKKKQAKRGYNQANIIAQGFAKNNSIHLKTNALKRMINTTTQTNKSRIERYQAMNNVFQVTNEFEISGKRIILIDDVITTGATSLSCAECLLTAGATSVLLMSIGYANPF